jgi:SAM-dependent methyltransferase
MHRKNLKTAYLQAKTQAGALTPERMQLGLREIETLKLLAAEAAFTGAPSAQLLDLGCADRFLEPACEAAGWNYMGVDYTDVDFEDGKLPVDDASVDIAISLAVIEHLKDPENFLAEIFRSLKPGGLVYLSTPNFQLDWKNFYNDPTHVRPYTPDSLEALLRLHGFISTTTFPGLRCKSINWYLGKNRFLKAYYLLPFRNDTRLPVPAFMRGHARSIFGLGIKPA